MYTIYQVTHEKNKKRFIGFTTRTMKEQKSEQLEQASLRSDSYMSHALKEDSAEHWTLDILETGTDGEYGRHRTHTLIEETNPDYNSILYGDGSEE